MRSRAGRCSCDRMVNCDQCDAVPGPCPQALACVKVIPQQHTAQITGLYWDKVDWETGSPRLAGMEVPPEHPPPIVLYWLPVIPRCGRVIRQTYHVWGMDNAGLFLSQ